MQLCEILPKLPGIFPRMRANRLERKLPADAVQIARCLPVGKEMRAQPRDGRAIEDDVVVELRAFPIGLDVVTNQRLEVAVNSAVQRRELRDARKKQQSRLGLDRSIVQSHRAEHAISDQRQRACANKHRGAQRGAQRTVAIHPEDRRDNEKRQWREHIFRQH